MHIHFDCFSGISGDMTLGAFIDIGVAVQRLKADIKSLPLEGFDLTVSPIMRNKINAKNVFVHANKDVHPRNYATIKKLIASSPLSDRVKNLSLDIFKRVANAESKIHNCHLEKVHFHEVGAIDAIVDIVGTALCVEYLGVKSVSASKIPLGSGFIECSHGTLPVPAPATVEILKGVPVFSSDIQCELVTPTGAAIITALTNSFGAMPEMKIEKIGYGSGKRDLGDTPNLLRIFTGTINEFSINNNHHNGFHANNTILNDTVVVVECCIDDMNSEIFGYLLEKLQGDGILDICWIPVFMKKNRPGTKVEVLCRKDNLNKVINRILSETTTIGVRYRETERKILDRKLIEVETEFGLVQVKKIMAPDGVCQFVPEYDVCRQIALKKKIPLKRVYDTIQKTHLKETFKELT